MNSNLDRFRAKARLLLAADRLRELIQFLEADIPTLIAEVEELQLELAEAKGRQGRYERPIPEVLKKSTEIPKEKPLLTSKEFAFALGVKESTVRSWTLLRKIKVVKVGHLVRIPRTEVLRIIDEGTIPVRPSRT